MRTHMLFQSTLLLRQILAQGRITTDVSLFLPATPYIRPVEWLSGGRTLLRIPYFWADDFEMEREAPRWRLLPYLRVGEGLKVFAFHPIHVYLNSANVEIYHAFKGRAPNVSQASPAIVSPYIQAGEGTCTLFRELIGHLARRGSICIRDVYDRWRNPGEGLRQQK
jgi:hypothetical protein